MYGFDGLMTRCLRNERVEKESLYYRLVVDTHSVDVF